MGMGAGRTHGFAPTGFCPCYRNKYGRINNMIFDPAIHHRRSIRLRGYDYSQAGAYFVTICTQDRTCLFGEPLDGEMRLNEAGKMIERWSIELENKFPDIQCDAFVCMPNHVHFIVVTVGADLRVCHGNIHPSNIYPDGIKKGEHTGSPLRDDGKTPQGANPGALSQPAMAF